MVHTTESTARVSAAGWMLRQWRTARGMSQLALATEAGVSTRHLSYVETGRAEPSRELLMKLAAALGMPPRDRNALLSAAGYQPIYKESKLDTQDTRELLHAVALILRQNDPFGAVAVDRDFAMVMCNRGFCAFLAILGVKDVPTPFTWLPPPRFNLLESVFDPAMGIRAGIKNWEQVAATTFWRARAELAATRDAHGREQLDRLLRHPGVTELLAAGPPESSGGFVLPLQMEVQGLTFSLFTTITTLGTPQDLTACELRVEAYHPADRATEALIRTLVPLDDDGKPDRA